MHVIFSCAPNKYQRQRISRKESAAEETRELDGGDIMLPLAVSAAETKLTMAYMLCISHIIVVLGINEILFNTSFCKKNPQSYQNDRPNKGSLMCDSPTPHPI